MEFKPGDILVRVSEHPEGFPHVGGEEELRRNIVILEFLSDAHFLSFRGSVPGIKAKQLYSNTEYNEYSQGYVGTWAKAYFIKLVNGQLILEV